jgi:hypothetical protein
MRVITAIENYNIKDNDVIVFLAGGITNCYNWQKEVIEELNKYPNTQNLIVLNPRRDNFPIGNPNAAREQIEWEFNGLHSADIFSMYFVNSESDQPICMYELGVHTTRANLTNKPFTIVISIEDGYKRENDVLIQTQLSMGDDSFINLNANPKNHAEAIYNDYIDILNWRQ